ncbi:alpha-tubulin suppressor-like RCC1 family protein [Tahibacter aquaticus]|uniref:Alpha-tubulin suppressor-like RCC1 family protein n=1 Tax=Tahibacter aquaticus TaxID=520092 RepID=A0A4R6YYH6_9GAMM|nr:RCC1 repeat-containing protein [Tahibacter aquaticus]TDR44016.1 alpha-tubulin suppressor-like RCC1 family protein [Tahibacter aquaticus]
MITSLSRSTPIPRPRRRRRPLPWFRALLAVATLLLPGLVAAKSVAAGTNRACAITAAGALKCWGASPGDGGGGSQAPVPVFGLEQGALHVAQGATQSCVLSTGGRLRCWGNNSYGQLGDNTTTARSTPADVVGFASGALDFAVGAEFGCAVTATGGVRCWGRNHQGQLGDNSTTQRNAPVDVPGLSAIRAVATGYYHACALSQAGAVKCWGYNNRGQLGDGSNLNRLTPIAVAGLGSGVSAIAAGGYTTCALLADATVRCWGQNDAGQLGDGSLVDRWQPTAVLSLSGVAEISVGGYHTCARSAAGAAFCWGANGNGELGDSTRLNRLTPVAVTDLGSAVTQIATGTELSCFRRSNHEIRCAGNGDVGALGNGFDGGWASLAQSLAALPEAVDKLAAGGHIGANIQDGHTCARTLSGGAWCWGSNYRGQLGQGHTNWSRNGPAVVTGYASGVRDIGAGSGHSCLLTQAGAVKCWGGNDQGQLGNNATGNRTLPEDVVGASSQVTQLGVGIFHNCVRTSAGGVRCWGDNNFGQLGDGTATDRRSAVDVAGMLSGMRSVSAGGSHSCAVSSAGALRCWGDNTYGQLGDGTVTARTTPVPVSGLGSGVDSVSLGEFHSCALLSSGAVKCWGLNDYGQVGDGGNTQQLLPVDVAGLGAGSTSSIEAGGRHTCARSGGGLLCWGINNRAQLGDGSTANRYVPTPAAGLSAGVNVYSAGGYHTCATRQGLVYCFGWGENGPLGNGRETDYLQAQAVATWLVAGDVIFRDSFQ